MSIPLDTETLAKQDIIARPAITGGDKEVEKKEPKPLLKDGGKKGVKAAKVSPTQELVEPDALETAASKVLSKTADDFRTHLGVETDQDFSTLLSEVLSGSFVALRCMTGKPWIRFVIAGGALGVSLVPPVLRYMAAKKEKTEKKDKE